MESAIRKNAFACVLIPFLQVSLLTFNWFQGITPGHYLNRKCQASFIIVLSCRVAPSEADPVRAYRACQWII